MNKLLIITVLCCQSVMPAWAYSSNDKYEGKTHEFVVKDYSVDVVWVYVCDRNNLCKQVGSESLGDN